MGVLMPLGPSLARCTFGVHVFCRRGRRTSHGRTQNLSSQGTRGSQGRHLLSTGAVSNTRGEVVVSRGPQAT